MTTRQYLRLLGEKDARAGKSINAFYDAPLAGHHRHNENARAEYELGYRAAKQEMRRELMDPRHLFEVRITLPVSAITDEYIQQLINAIQAVQPEIKGQRCTVCYQGSEERRQAR